MNPSRRSPLTVIFLTVFIDLLGFGIVIPLLPLYAQTFGASGAAVGLLVTVYSLAQFLSAPLWGRLSDRVGRRPVILAGLAGSALAYLLLGLAQSLEVLFAARILAGITTGNLAAAQAYIADVTTPETRARGMGLFGAAFGLGFVFGPAIGGLLSRFGFGVPGFFAAGLSASSWCLALWLLPESRLAAATAAPRRRVWGQIWAAMGQARLAAPLAIFFAATFAFANWETTFPLLGRARFRFSAAQIGYLFAYVGTLMALIQGLLVGRLVSRFGEWRLVILGTCLMLAGLVCVALAPNVWALAAALALLACGSGVNTPSLSSLISRAGGAGEQGGVLGISQALASLARIVGPAWGGFTYDHFGMGSPYLTASGLLALAFIVSLQGAGRAVAPRPSVR